MRAIGISNIHFEPDDEDDEPEYEWDEAKRRTNLAKHGVDFASVRGFDWDTAKVAKDTRRDYGETRYTGFGAIGDRRHVPVFAVRGDRIRLIGSRLANTKEISRHAPPFH